jgi:hypothetical protein
MNLSKIVSGGQTGADRAALDAAIEANFRTGGWVPAGRFAEDGVISPHYLNLKETPSTDVSERTRRNVLDSDATLIVFHGSIAGGTKLTWEYAAEIGKPCKLVNLDHVSEAAASEEIRSWLDLLDISILNVAGPRASEDPEIYVCVFRLITRLLNSSR